MPKAPCILPIFGRQFSLMSGEQARDNKASRWNAMHLVVAAIFSCYLAACIFPESWWGANGLAFLPPVWSVVIVLVAGYFAFFFRGDFSSVGSKEVSGSAKMIAPALGLAAGAIFYQLDMNFDAYGDAPKFFDVMQRFDPATTKLDHWKLFLDLDLLNPKIGERTVLNAVALLATHLEVSGVVAFRIFAAVMGGLYTYASLAFVRCYFKDKTWRWILGIVFCTAPILLNFLGHFEIYAPTLLLFAAYFMLLLLYFRAPSWLKAVGVIFLQLLAMKFHASALLLTLPTVLMVVYAVAQKRAWLHKLFTWKRSTLFILFPIIVVGVYIYVGVLKDHVDPRWLKSDLVVYERLFLPIFSPEPPLDRYNLLSFAHLADYWNELLMWSGAAILSLLIFLTAWRKKIHWNRPELVVVGLSLIVFAGFYFMVNPLLGMPVDWDLLALPAPILMCFVAAIAADKGLEASGKQLLGPIIGIAVLGLSIVPVHFSDAMLSQRLERIGAHTFKTYWITGVADIEFAMKLEPDAQAFERRMQGLIEELEPYAIEGKDIEYSQLLRIMGKYYREQNVQLERSLDYHEAAYAYAPENMPNVVGLVESYFTTNNLEGAYAGCKILLENSHPSRPMALRMCLQLALETDRYQEALNYASAYVKESPGDQFVEEIYRDLLSGNNLNELKYRFSRSR